MSNQRIDSLRKRLIELQIDVFLVSNYYNIFYLSDFKTLTENEREAWMLVTANDIYLFTDDRYIKSQSSIRQLADKAHKLKLLTPEKGLIRHLQEIFTEENIKTCGVEAGDLRLIEFQHFIKHIREARFIPTDRLIVKLREIKDDDEINKVKVACGIADQCLEEVIKTIKIGTTEKEIAFKIEFWLKQKNHDLAFYPIVAIDKNSALPHYDTRDGNNQAVENGSVVLIDFGAKYQNYLSDITRMIFIGNVNQEIINTYNKLLNSQEGTIKFLDTMRSSHNYFKEVDKFCRDKNEVQSLPNFSHSTGHGVGLEIHEYPKVSINSEDKIEPNQIITIEPGVYFEGKWGMRIEDTLLIKEEGVEVLTKLDKKSLIISNS
ncbi:MAG: Peptidase M24 [Candidatus Roizmanbacteria bacterium GW2011_GWA2_35_19]|uniref:Peptidase M24 n=2 Tax=Candidatus Roizmaniibacteriota TaxID=1752723 RepID=A0A0G0ECI1_9BACT|nr:MAG: Peptidase M24 [Candidatus Roizmanbacteria bacterium GW2011_GWC2_35_12]KKP72970.1 MAG: Peptidase M24 [Candidatus Roizmanbacteria bacterium GW2011_GWA2_35_19]